MARGLIPILNWANPVRSFITRPDVNHRSCLLIVQSRAAQRMHGSFKSTVHSVNSHWLFIKVVQGDIRVDLPLDLEAKIQRGDAIETTATFTYTGLYRLQETSVFTLKYEATDGGQGSQKGTVTFKGQSRSTNQTVDFQVDGISSRAMSGRYTCRAPGDAGTFELRRIQGLAF